MTTLGQIILYSNYFVLFLFYSFAKRKPKHKRLGVIKKFIFYQPGFVILIKHIFIELKFLYSNKKKV